MGGVDFGGKFLNLTDTEHPTLAAAQEAGDATFNYGLFSMAVLEFFIIAFVIFMLVKGVNSLKKKEEEAPAAPPADITLLTEIRDALKKK